MMRIYAIAVNTFREAVRDRILFGVVGLAAAVLVFTLALGQLSLDQERRVVEDIGLASISLFAVVVAVFLGSSLLYKEIERKTLYVILPKPIHRWEFLVGKYAGITLTGAVFVAVMGGVLLLVMGAQAGGSAGLVGGIAAGLLALLGLGAWKLSDVSRLLLPWSAALLAAGALFAQGAGVAVGPVLMALLLNVGEVSILTAVALFFSSFSTPFLTGAFTLGVWLAGRSADSMQTMRSPLLGDAIVAVLHGLARVVPNFNLFVPGPGTLGEAGAWGYVGTTTAYGVVYTAALLVAAALLFRRRDFQ